MSKKPPPSGKKGLDPADIAVWEHVTRDVKPYRPRKAATETLAIKKEPAKAASAPKLPQARPAAPRPEKSPPPPSAGFDRATAAKLKKGKLPVEGRIDLHGMTQDEAFASLRRFIRAAVKSEKRTVLVITGKGEKSQGVLKRMLPLWLQDGDIAPHVIGFSAASAKDGGAGAWYLRLRKPPRRD